MSAWQTIDSAPKGRTVLAGYRNSHGHWRTLRAMYAEPRTIELDEDSWSADEDEEGRCWLTEGWYEDPVEGETWHSLSYPPTHWQPLPDPPSAV